MKRLLALISAQVVACTASAQAPGGSPPATRPAVRDTSRAEQRVDAIAAVVQGEPIFQSEVDEQLYLFVLQSGAHPDSAQQIDVRHDILDRLIDEKLIVQEAKRKKVTLVDADVEKQVGEAIADVKQRVGGEEAYKAELDREGITEADLRERYRGEVRRQMLANQLLRKELNLKLEVSPAEAEAYFKANPKDFPKKPPEVRVAVIQIPVEPVAGARDVAKKRADAVVARLTKGEPFTRVAQEVSEDPGTRRSGGDLGFFGRGDLDSTFERAAFALKPGQTSGLVETPFGFHIIRVEEIDSTRNEVHARHILIRVPVTEEDEKRAADLASKAYDEASKGMDFAVLVRRYSKFKGAQQPGGDIGFLPVTAFSPEFRAVVDTVEVGDVTPPLRNPQGYHVFKVLDRRPERPYELAEVKSQLPELVRQIKLRKQYDNWVVSLRAKAHVEIKQGK